jgi:hypothetical protein
MVSLGRLFSLAAFVPWALAQGSSKDLGSVLADKKNLSTFYKLIQVHAYALSIHMRFIHMRAGVHRNIC